VIEKVYVDSDTDSKHVCTTTNYEKQC